MTYWAGQTTALQVTARDTEPVERPAMRAIWGACRFDSTGITSHDREEMNMGASNDPPYPPLPTNPKTPVPTRPKDAQPDQKK